MSDKVKIDSLKYHSGDRPGKISVQSSKPCKTQQDLSLAYTPGVAIPCLEIKDNPENIWKYTVKDNFVAVVSDGTAVLGLGNIGPEASMPVMEGKAVLFKRFAGIDAVPICLDKVFNEDGSSNAEKIIETVERLQPTFGGINLEDIASPACFEIEQKLKKSMSIPVFHDDQHGTAIISTAAILNALKILGKKIEDAKFVMSGAGAAGTACAKMYITAGAKAENIILCDINGVLHSGRNDIPEEKKEFAHDIEDRTLEDAIKGADVFIGVSVGNCVTEEMIKSMGKDPIVFPMANPIPEIMPEKALNAGAAVVGTGRSDFMNQINNVLGFPGIFRGALDVRALDINEDMKLAASRAIAEIANEKLPTDVYELLSKAYPEDAANGMFDGDSPLKKTYVIPKPFDPRVVPRVARYVAEAAMKSGVAQVKIDDLELYEISVRNRIEND